MGFFPRMDDLVRHRLQYWPQHPPGVVPRSFGRDAWLRARPGGAESDWQHPFLKLPGSNRLRTLPDGLWLNFGGTPQDGFVDILVIEACSTLTNMLDKRSRFAPSTQSLLAVCPVSWLLDPVAAPRAGVPGEIAGNALSVDATPRWRSTGIMVQPPVTPLILPVRDVRVLYGLKNRQYLGFATSQVPHPHEYFVPMDVIIAENGHEHPGLLALLKRATMTANFFTVPEDTRATRTGRLPPIYAGDGRAGR